MWSVMIRTIANTVLAALALLLIGLSGCDQSVQETMRVTSPDGKVDAIVTVSNSGAFGATTSEGYQVHVTARGAEPEEADEQFRADHVRALRVYWKANRFLVIEYAEARIFQFSNFWSAESVDQHKYVVQIRLKP
jgi:hypothetical protein